MNLTVMSPDECRQHLRQLILDKALQFGDFTLASGKKSSYYIDCRPVVLSGEGAYCLARIAIDIQHHNVEAGRDAILLAIR